MTDMIIVGGGLNGPMLALAAAQSGVRSVVIDSLPTDRRRDPAFDGRAYALALTSCRMLEKLGLWEAVAENAQPMNEIKVTDGRAGEGASPWMMHFDHAEIGEGPLGHLVEDRHLRLALLDAMDQAPLITHRPGKAVVDQQIGPSAKVTLGNGETVEGALIVGADGRRSGTAERAGIGRTGWDYEQTALVCAVEHELPHHGVAHQFFMPGGPLAILPLTGNRSSIVWSEDSARAAGYADLDDAAFLEVLKPAFGSFLGALKLSGARFTYPLGLTLAERFVEPRLALVGDAAHGVHPIAGQGLNAGLRDVAALSAVLAEARRRGEDIGSVQVLRRYEQWRRFDTAALSVATDAFNRLFSNDSAVLRGLRDIGMGAVSAIPAARRGFMREAAGLTGDIPPLMQP